MNNEKVNDRAMYILRPGYQIMRDDVLWEPFMAYAKEIKADAIMAFNLHIEANQPSLASLRERLPLFAARFAEVRAAGMSPQINYYTTLGHGAMFPEPHALHFINIKDGYGHEPTGCPCLLCPDFRKYIREAYALFASLDIDAMWIDDDFRLNSRAGAATFQCFCDLHLTAYAARSGHCVHREQMMDILLKPVDNCSDDDLALRQDWRDFQEEKLLDLTREIRDACVAVNPHIVMGFMPLSAEFNLHNGRDTNADIRALRTANQPEPWIRIGNPVYTDENLPAILDRCLSFDYSSAWITEPCRKSSEIENFPWTVGGKSARGLSLEMYMLAMTVSGLFTLSINDTFYGFDDVPGHYRSTLRSLKPYYQALRDAVQHKQRKGTSLPLPGQSDMMARLDLRQMPHLQRNFSLAQIGIPIAPADGCPVLVTKQEAMAYSVAEIEAWLSRGAVLTSEAYYYLQNNKGMLQDCPIRVRRVEPIPQTCFVAERTSLAAAPAWLRERDMLTWGYLPIHTDYQIDAGDGAKVWSVLYDNLGRAQLNGVVVADLPYRIAVVAHTGMQLKESGRQWLYQHLLDYVSAGQFPVMVEQGVNLYPIWWEAEREIILGLANFSLENYETWSLWIPKLTRLSQVEVLSRDGNWIPASYTVNKHPQRGIRLLLTGDLVPEHASFETYRLIP